MTTDQSKRTSSSEGAPGLPMLAFVGVLFVAAVASTWVVYESVPASSFFGGVRSAGPAPTSALGYAIASHGTASHAATSASIADVEVGIQWNAWDWKFAELVGTTVHAALQRAAPGAVITDSDSAMLVMTPGAIDDRFRFRAFEGPFDALTTQERMAIVEDLATALEVFLPMPGFDGIVLIELAFVSPDRTFERFEIARDPADPTVLVARPLP